MDGVTNYAYVKIKNRGTSAANNVVVKGYHCLPGAGLTWPTDFQQMTPTAGLPVASLAGNDAAEVTVGPFAWTPNANVYGHDCILMIVSAPGDPSNVDNFTAGESIAEWRLVPHDNNVGQRNVQLVPGGGESRGLMAGLHEHVFFAGNTFRRPAKMRLDVRLPAVLRSRGWRVGFRDVDEHFVLKPGERRKVVLDVTPGAGFTKEDVEAATDRDIVVTLYGNEMMLGGMTYRIDPHLKRPVNEPGKDSKKCTDKADALLECLDIKSAKAKRVCVRKVTVDIEVDNDCDCE